MKREGRERKMDPHDDRHNTNKDGKSNEIMTLTERMCQQHQPNQSKKINNNNNKYFTTSL